MHEEDLMEDPEFGPLLYRFQTTLKQEALAKQKAHAKPAVHKEEVPPGGPTPLVDGSQQRRLVGAAADADWEADKLLEAVGCSRAPRKEAKESDVLLKASMHYDAAQLRADLAQARENAPLLRALLHATGHQGSLLSPSAALDSLRFVPASG